MPHECPGFEPTPQQSEAGLSLSLGKAEYCSHVGHCCAVEQSTMFFPNIAGTWVWLFPRWMSGHSPGKLGVRGGGEWWWCSPLLWGSLLNLFSVPVNLHSVYRAVSWRRLLVPVTAFHPEDDATYLPFSEFTANAVNTLMVLHFTSHNLSEYLNRSHQIWYETNSLIGKVQRNLYRAGSLMTSYDIGF
jgi:hypothetical protein